jgi:HlyD family secretion protein
LAQWQAQKEIQTNPFSRFRDYRISQEQNYIITAPISGRLVNFSGVQKGNFIVQGQSIGEISPEENMVAECMVSLKTLALSRKTKK